MNKLIILSIIISTTVINTFGTVDFYEFDDLDWGDPYSKVANIYPDLKNNLSGKYIQFQFDKNKLIIASMMVPDKYEDVVDLAIKEFGEGKYITEVGEGNYIKRIERYQIIFNDNITALEITKLKMHTLISFINIKAFNDKFASRPTESKINKKLVVTPQPKILKYSNFTSSYNSFLAEKGIKDDYIDDGETILTKCKISTNKPSLYGNKDKDIIITEIIVNKDLREPNGLEDFLTTATNVAEYVIGKDGKEAIINLKEKRDNQARKGIDTIYNKNGYTFSMGGSIYSTEFTVKKQFLTGLDRMNLMDNYNSFIIKNGKNGQLKSYSSIKGQGNYSTTTSPVFEISPLGISDIIGLEVMGNVDTNERIEAFKLTVSNVAEFVVGEDEGKEAISLLFKKYDEGDVDKRRVSEMNKNIISSTSISKNNYTYYVEYAPNFSTYIGKFTIMPTSLNPNAIKKE